MLLGRMACCHLTLLLFGVILATTEKATSLRLFLLVVLLVLVEVVLLDIRNLFFHDEFGLLGSGC